MQSLHVCGKVVTVTRGIRPIKTATAQAILLWVAATTCSTLANPSPAVEPSPPKQWQDWCRAFSVDQPRVFKKGHQIRFLFTSDAWRVELKGRFRRAPRTYAAYQLEVEELEYDPHPPPTPSPEDGWTAVRVIAGDAWQELLRQVDNRITPTPPGEGIYFQTTSGDGVLARDNQGIARLLDFEELPDSVRLVRRYGIQEFSVVYAKAVQAALAADGTTPDLVCLVMPRRGDLVEFALLDHGEQRAVLCVPPRPAEVADAGVSPRKGLLDLASFGMEDHVWATLKNPVSSVGRLVDRGVQFVGNLFSPSLRSKPRTVPPLQSHTGGMDLGAWEAWLNLNTGTRSELGSVRFLVDGQEFFPVFEERLHAARAHVHLLVCIFDNDDVAVGIADILRERSAEIDVHVILDRFSSRSSARAWPITAMPEGFTPPKSIGRYLERNSDVQVRPFLNTWTSAEHSKVYLVDGTHAYVGGMNLGREYRYEWHDLMAEIEGPIVAALEWEFAGAWAHASALGDLAFASHKLLGRRPYRFTDRHHWVNLRRLNTRTTEKTIRKALLEGLRRAEHEVFLENPYLFSNEVIVSLARARQRGVDVRVVLGTDNNMMGGAGSNVAVANYLLRHGVRVFLYPGMSHVKAVYIDGWVTWGSANFSGLSLKNNLEVNLASSAPSVASELRQRLFETDFKAATELTEPLTSNWSDRLLQSLLNQL